MASGTAAAILEWIVQHPTFALVIVGLMGGVYTLLQIIQKHFQKKKRRKSLRNSLRNEMKDMYRPILAMHSNRRDPETTGQILFTEKYESEISNLHLLTQTEQRHVEKFYREVKAAKQSVDDPKAGVPMSWKQYNEIQKRDLHDKLLKALNAIEEQLSEEKTSPDNWNPEEDFGPTDAERMLG